MSSIFARAKLHAHKTPYYLYDIRLLEHTLQHLQTEADKFGYMVHYAVKANANNRVLDKIQSYGFGSDCVSGNEVRKSIQAGFSPAKIVYAGVGKSDWEIEYSLDQKIFGFNCESIEEIQVINEIAAGKGVIAPISIRINPDVNANTHFYITTGIEENKFGISFSAIDRVLEVISGAKNIKLIGLHFHIGSQITDLQPYQDLCIKVNEVQKDLLERHVMLKHLNLGGGLGIDYEKPDEEPMVDFSKFFGVFDCFLDKYPGQKIHFELGRSVVANSASLISRVLYVKQGINRSFVILDAGMTELIRPALYQAYHKIEHLTPRLGSTHHYYDVVGPICESSDCFGKRIRLPEVFRGDLIAIRSTGAYGEVMASNYNLRELPRAYYF